MNKTTRYIPLIIALCLALGYALGTGLEKLKPEWRNPKLSNGQSSSSGNTTIDEIIQYISTRYVDKISQEDITEKMIQSALLELDPHSSYISPKELLRVNEDMEGNFNGIGIEFQLIQDTITIISVLSNGPSRDAGLLSGDQIVFINDSLVAGKKMDSEDVIRYLRGASGTKVKVGIRRNQSKSTLNFTLNRSQLANSSIDAAYKLNTNSIYVKINRFSSQTYAEFMTVMDSLTTNKEKVNLVLDLRQNPGGYLQEATNLLNQIFGEKNKLLVYTKGRNQRRTDYETTGMTRLNIANVAVLIDEGSASASEIVAGAIQDWDRGVVIGRRSFGKGLVQEQYDLTNGGALRLTIAKYFTPSGRCIQKDYHDLNKYSNELGERLKDGELLGKTVNQISLDTSKYVTSRGRNVKGGGGISPDFFIPTDSLMYSDVFLDFRIAMSSWCVKNKSILATVPKDFSDFMKWQVSDKMIQNFISEAQKGKTSVSIEMKQMLKKYLKSNIARLNFNETAMYQVLNDDDPVVNKAVLQIKQKSSLTVQK